MVKWALGAPDKKSNQPGRSALERRERSTFERRSMTTHRDCRLSTLPSVTGIDPVKLLSARELQTSGKHSVSEMESRLRKVLEQGRACADSWDQADLQPQCFQSLRCWSRNHVTSQRDRCNFDRLLRLPTSAQLFYPSCQKKWLHNPTARDKRRVYIGRQTCTDGAIFTGGTRLAAPKATYRKVRDCRLPKEGGMVPVRWLLPRSLQQERKQLKRDQAS